MINPSFKKVLLIFASIVALVLLIISFTALYFIKANKSLLNVSGEKYQPGPSQPISGILKAGTVGEVNETDDGKNPDVPRQNKQLPQVIANVSGDIKEIKSDRIIAKGDGVNFQDGVLRDLVAVFTAQTSTITAVKTKVIRYTGLEGLKYLKIGDKVLIEGAENLRGKTEFKVKTVTVF